ncbi:unnamed protein product [Echinostoma caproni]|uniref:Vesicle transport protein n=1 Tax=Echinostoma caproni TaxID=27848 RepID=A0A183BE51_9TREM|nr:unnamed protein product [Echinostoma caproni]
MSARNPIAVDVSTSVPIVEFLENCRTAKNFPEPLKMSVDRILLEKNHIRFSIVCECHTWMKNNGKVSPPHLWKLFRSTTVVLPVPKPTPRNPELDARVNALRTKFANDEYNRMIENLGPKIAVPLNKESGVSVCSELKCLNKQLMMILNFIIIISSGFAFGYFIPEMISSAHEVNFTTRIMCALSVSFLVFFADLYFLLKNLNEYLFNFTLIESSKKIS